MAGLVGCSNDIDPDTLVRELRVLALRFGDSSPGSVAEVQATVDLSSGMPALDFTSPSIDITVLAVAPTGPGRRITAPGPRPLQYDWFACIGPLSLFSPGSLDPQCLKFAPGDPPPRQNSGLLPLIPNGPVAGNPTLTLQTAGLKSLLGQFLEAALTPGSSTGGGGSGSGLMLPTHPIAILFPILVQVSVVGGDPQNSLDSEVAYGFLQIVVALPGMTLPPPNHNPMLPAAGGVEFGAMATGAMTELAPCADPSYGDCQRYPTNRTDPVYVTGSTAPGSIEIYDPLDDSGRTQVAETMRYAWFSTDGTFNDERTGDSQPQTYWQNGDDRPAPPEVQVVDLWLVVQDERAGVDYQRFQMGFQ